MRTSTFALFAALSVSGVATIAAQAPCGINDGPAQYAFLDFANSCASIGGTSDMSVGGPDHLFQHWWYACIDGGPGACALNNATGMTADCSEVGGRLGRITSSDWDGTGRLEANWTVHIYATDVMAGVAASCMTVTNTSSGPVPVTLYGYVDVDNGGFANDEPQQLLGWPDGNHAVIDQASPDVMYVTGLGFGAWESDVYPQLQNRILNNFTGCTVLSNSYNGTPPHDYTSAMSWSRTLEPGESFTAQMAIGYNQEPPCQNGAVARTYCVGKPGTNGVPRWNTESLPFVGAAVPLIIDNGFPGSAPVVALGLEQAFLPLPPIGTLCVQPLLTTFFLPPFGGSGQTGAPLPLPNDPFFCGAQFTMQGFFADPGATGSIAHTDGLLWSLGSFSARQNEYDPVFTQVDAVLDGVSVPRSDWGSMDVLIPGSLFPGEVRYVNLNIDGRWEVENMPVVQYEAPGVPQSTTFNFSLGNTPGTRVPSVTYGYSLTSNVLAGPPPQVGGARVGVRPVKMNDGETGPGLVINNARPMRGGAVQAAATVGITCAPVPNQDCADDQCVPAAVSNALRYLKAKHPTIAITNAQSTIANMKTATGWTASGCSSTWPVTKDAYMRANGIPVTTTTTTNVDTAIAALNMGCAVEFRSTGHAAIVTSIVKLSSGKVGVTVKHDTDQGNAGGQKTETVIWDPSDNSLWDGWAFDGGTFRAFTIECPSP